VSEAHIIQGTTWSRREIFLQDIEAKYHLFGPWSARGLTSLVGLTIGAAFKTVAS